MVNEKTGDKFMNKNIIIPEPIASFLIYIESIQGKSAKTADEYFYDLRTFCRFLKIHFGLADENSDFENISIEDISIELFRRIDLSVLYEYLNYLNRGRGNSAATRARKITSVKSFFKYLCNKAKLLETNPAADLDYVKQPKQLPRYFTIDESLALLEVIDGDYKERDYCMITLFLNCGMRLSELVNINITDIHGDSLTVIGKGGKERSVYLNEACLNALEQYLPIRKEQPATASDKTALFLSRLGKRISRRTVQYTVEKYVSKLGLDPHKYTTHKLRHTAATLMHQAGVDVRVLQEILGHEQLSTTEIYTHINNDQIRAAVDKNPLAKVKQN